MSYDPEVQSSLDLYRQTGFSDYQIYDAGTNRMFTPDNNDSVKVIQQAVSIPDMGSLYNNIRDYALKQKQTILDAQAASIPSAQTTPFSSMGYSTSLFGGSSLKGFNLGSMSVQSILLYLSLFMKNPKLNTAMKGSMLGGNIGAAAAYFFGNKANRIMALGNILGINIPSILSNFGNSTVRSMGLASLAANPATLMVLAAVGIPMLKKLTGTGYRRRRRSFRRSFRPYRRSYRRSYRRRRY